MAQHWRSRRDEKRNTRVSALHVAELRIGMRSTALFAKSLVVLTFPGRCEGAFRQVYVCYDPPAEAGVKMVTFTLAGNKTTTNWTLGIVFANCTSDKAIWDRILL